MSQMPPNPPAPPPAGGQPVGPPTPAGTSGVVKAIVAVVVLAIVAGGAFLLLGGDDDGDAADPAQAVRDYFAAALDRDCERLMGLVSEASWSDGGTVDREGALAQCASEVQEEDFIPAGLRVDAVEVTDRGDDTAEVRLTSTSDAQGEQTETIALVREDGRWVVDFAAAEPDDAGG
jgi:hypothetical protein